MNRRKFLQGSSLAALAMAAYPRRTAASGEQAFTTITYNILAARGYPERDANRTRLQNARPQMPRRIAQELALYQPHLVTFQESAAEDVMARIAGDLEMNHVYFPGGFPGTLMSCYEIVESTNCPLAGEVEGAAELFSRHWGRAVLRVDGTDMVVYSAHLHPGDAAIQKREVAAMVAAMSEDLSAGRPLILQGDLNHDPTDPNYQSWVDTGLQDAFADCGSGEGLTCSTTNLRWRIDYVWSAGPLSEQLASCRVLDEGAFIENANDPASFALSDHLPVIATFTI
ncbi:MAG: endonuclease/exonuclease/phosphatase family protein [Pirellulaceae bacterium]